MSWLLARLRAGLSALLAITTVIIRISLTMAPTNVSIFVPAQGESPFCAVAEAKKQHQRHDHGADVGRDEKEEVPVDSGRDQRIRWGGPSLHEDEVRNHHDQRNGKQHLFSEDIFSVVDVPGNRAVSGIPDYGGVRISTVTVGVSRGQSNSAEQHRVLQLINATALRYREQAAQTIDGTVTKLPAKLMPGARNALDEPPHTGPLGKLLLDYSPGLTTFQARTFDNEGPSSISWSDDLVAFRAPPT